MTCETHGVEDCPGCQWRPGAPDYPLELMQETNIKIGHMGESIARLKEEIRDLKRQLEVSDRIAQMRGVAAGEYLDDCNRMRATLEEFQKQDRTRGYPTGPEWIGLMGLTHLCLESLKRE